MCSGSCLQHQLCKLGHTFSNNLHSVSAETRALPSGCPAHLSLPPCWRKLEEARLADMHSGADTFRKLFARA